MLARIRAKLTYANVVSKALGLAAGLLLGLLGMTPPPSEAASVSVRGSTLVYRASPGEANRLLITEEDEGVLDVSDDGARRVRPGTGCRRLDRRQAECRELPRGKLELHLGDRDDRTRVELPGTQFGGSGDDTLRGTGLRDQLLGGSGIDHLRGGDGSDALLGGTGDDRLIGHAGNDRYVGGGGDDRLNSVDFNSETVDCGTGQDRLNAQRRDTFTDCEQVWRWPTFYREFGPEKTLRHITVLRTSGPEVKFDFWLPCTDTRSEFSFDLENDFFARGLARIGRDGFFRASFDQSRVREPDNGTISGTLDRNRVRGSIVGEGCNAPHPFDLESVD